MPINYLFVLDLQATCFPSWWVDEWFPEIIGKCNVIQIVSVQMTTML